MKDIKPERLHCRYRVSSKGHTCTIKREFSDFVCSFQCIFRPRRYLGFFCLGVVWFFSTLMLLYQKTGDTNNSRISAEVDWKGAGYVAIKSQKKPEDSFIITFKIRVVPRE